jgi:23S rRNA pseudouridine955/2504/2580 synthase
MSKEEAMPTEPTPDATPGAKSGGVTLLTVTEDEAGLRIDRWFRRRYPTLALSHLAKICRKGEVRVDGKRVETSTRLE